jgi:hypothetical protein
MPNDVTPAAPAGAAVPDYDADPEARAAALTGTELTALEELVPGPAEQALLDYAKGAHLGLPEVVDLITEVGGLATMLEHQARTIRTQAETIRTQAETIRTLQAKTVTHLRAGLARHLHAARQAAAAREGLPE